MLNQPAFSDDILSFLATRETRQVDIAVLQPADPFLDMAGEDLRRRIFLTQNETGDMLCLRPEFTIPVCLSHIESASGTPQRYAYLGQVFRQRRDGATEFFQAGVEDLGDTAFANADARAVADAEQVLQVVLPDTALDITLGDQAVFEAVVEDLGLPAGWQRRLIRAFGNTAQIDDMLHRLSHPQSSAVAGDPVVTDLVAGSDRNALVAFIDSRMLETGLLINSSRTPSEIADRLMEKARLANTRLEAGALDSLKRFLSLDTPLLDAPEALSNFSRTAGIDLSQALAMFEARIAALKDNGSGVANVRYRAAFGRPLDYYTGLVFEIASDGLVLAGGGRFDRLLTLLGAPEPIPAVGFSLWLDRIERLVEQRVTGAAA